MPECYLPCTDPFSPISHFHPLPCLHPRPGAQPSWPGPGISGFLHGLLSVSPTMEVGSRQVPIKRGDWTLGICTFIRLEGKIGRTCPWPGELGWGPMDCRNLEGSKQSFRKSSQIHTERVASRQYLERSAKKVREVSRRRFIKARIC